MSVVSSSDENEVRQILKKAKLADSVSLAVIDDQMLFVFSRSGRPVIKMPVECVLTAYDFFVSNLESDFKAH